MNRMIDLSDWRSRCMVCARLMHKNNTREDCDNRDNNNNNNYINVLYIYLFIYFYFFIIFRHLLSAVRLRRPFPHLTDSRHDDRCGGFSKFPRDQEGGIGEWKSNVSFTQWCWHHRNPKLEIWAWALLRNVRNIRICMWKIPIVSHSVTYDNDRFPIKNSLPYLHCV